MAGSKEKVLFDADALINLWGFGRKYLNRLCRKINIVISETVASEVKGAKERGTGHWRAFPKEKIGSDGFPDLFCLDDLDSEHYVEYLKYFQLLQGADAGERETFALAWVLGLDVCSYDQEAEGLWRKHKPPEVPSKHLYLMDILRQNKVL